MAALSNRLIETLVNLVENELLSMSSGKQDLCAEYQTLQDCRYSLLAMAAKADEANVFAPPGPDLKIRAHHLKVISGGKA